MKIISDCNEDAVLMKTLHTFERCDVFAHAVQSSGDTGTQTLSLSVKLNYSGTHGAVRQCLPSVSEPSSSCAPSGTLSAPGHSNYTGTLQIKTTWQYGCYRDTWFVLWNCFISNSNSIIKWILSQRFSHCLLSPHVLAAPCRPSVSTAYVARGGPSRQIPKRGESTDVTLMAAIRCTPRAPI